MFFPLFSTQGTLESASELLEEWLLSLDVHAPVLLVLDNAEDPIKYDGTVCVCFLYLCIWMYIYIYIYMYLCAYEAGVLVCE